jgi:hypothetical protein
LTRWTAILSLRTETGLIAASRADPTVESWGATPRPPLDGRRAERCHQLLHERDNRFVPQTGDSLRSVAAVIVGIVAGLGFGVLVPFGAVLVFGVGDLGRVGMDASARWSCALTNLAEG